MSSEITEEVERQYNILVFGIERRGLPIPAPIETRNYKVTFEAYGAPCRFNEYDGVILFKGLFERLERKASYSSSYWEHNYDVDELDKRKKELVLLIRQGGFVCFLLADKFIDIADGNDVSGTDLAKYCLVFSDFYRKNFTNRVAGVTAAMSEFKAFLDRFGAAHSYFEYYTKNLTVRPIAKVGDTLVGALFMRRIYAIPTLVPDPREEVVHDYFKLLVDALTAVENKHHHEVPEWAVAFSFAEETGLRDKRSELEVQIKDIDERLGQLKAYKSALVTTGQDLVSDVVGIFETGLKIRVDATDEYKEDVKLLDVEGEVIAVAEIKGTNRGLKREYINQTDSHRERSGLGSSFPALLIMNTHIKNARSVEEKDREVAKEQIAHAVKMNVLILRTLDLLGLIRLVLAGELNRDEAINLLLNNAGWLRVSGDKPELQTGE